MCQILLRIQVGTERAHWSQKSHLSEVMCRQKSYLSEVMCSNTHCSIWRKKWKGRNGDSFFRRFVFKQGGKKRGS